LMILGVALLFGCGSSRSSGLQISDGSAGTGGSSEPGGSSGTGGSSETGGSGGGTGAGGLQGGGGFTGTGGLFGTGGSTGVGGLQGTGGYTGAGGSTINCALLGCAAPPMCATGCTATCGCCPCSEGTWQGNLVCHGGCWAETDAGVDSGGDTSAFESFRLTQSYGPCPSEMDCVGYIDLDKTGQLLRDQLSSPGAAVGSARITEAELAGAIAVLTDPTLVELLDAGEPPCVAPMDIFETMKLVAAGVTHGNSTTMCNNAPINAARDLIYQLGDKYLPPATR
jgi:hypothetical protein